MPNIAILQANATYTHLPDLECCQEDLAVMRKLVEATGRFQIIKEIFDADADDVKKEIRSALSTDGDIDEVFYYFTGHGSQIDREFFYCAKTFDSDRPNETGLSNSELHTLLRSVNPETVIKVVDACSSGTLLIKADGGFLPVQKDTFRNLIQISSCLDAQNSLTGDPISKFTESFCHACVRKTDGHVYYTDIINTLRDDFIGNNSQTPHFVSQGTGREMFVDDVGKLASFRDFFSKLIAPSPREVVTPNGDAPSSEASALELLERAEAKMVTPESMKAFVDGLFDGLTERLKLSEFADYYGSEADFHSDFKESTSQAFITRVLHKEGRIDDLVTAEVKRKKKRRGPWDNFTVSALYGFYDDDEINETFDLTLNCEMDRAQVKICLTPKFKSLQQFILVVTCAPSLDTCYVFEILTQHALRDWSEYSAEGKEIVRRWYKFGWTDSTEFVVNKICGAFEDAVRANLEQTTKRLASDKE